MTKKFYRTLAVPFYLGAVLLLASWQNQLSFVQEYGRESSVDEKGVGEEGEGEGTDGVGVLVKSARLRILGEPEGGWTLPDEDLFQEELNTTIREGPAKKIFVWSGDFSQSHLGGCPHWNCQVTKDRAHLDTADAVLFYNGFHGNPPVRHPSQYYVYFTQESPAYMHLNEPYPGYVNLTMGFRRDADLPCPYGYSIQRNTPLPDDVMQKSYSPEVLSKKTKHVAWFVSNCGSQSKRDLYVKELQKYIPVDVYGSCGNLNCPKHAMNSCLDKLRKEYRFYLALENSICKDYVTEKFWEKGALIPIVPLVLKRSVLEPYVPPHSFIAVDDFPSPQLLAEHLWSLTNDSHKYAQYFSWKKNYEIVFLNGNNHDRMEQPWGFCRLCSLLWESPRPLKIRKDTNKWWREEAKCDTSLVTNILAGANPKHTENKLAPETLALLKNNRKRLKPQLTTPK